MIAVLRVVDLPAELAGAGCVICAAMGEHVVARYVDREGGPVCEGCFTVLLRLEASLVKQRHEEEAGCAR